MLEAERQKSAFGHLEDWAIEFSQLVEDDVFATFVQVYFLACHLHQIFDTLFIKKNI